MKRIHILLLALLIPTALVAGFAFQATRTPPPPAMATLLPPGALLTIESPDFAGILAAWNQSPQQTAWLESANYSVFANSRLFSRLTDAQGEFLSAAALPTDVDLLKEVAGKQSIFAWYDIGNLEFLYVTRMPAARSAQTALMQTRSKFSRRQSGDTAFYVRSEPSATGHGTRTVAFATSGDWLLLATREDLLANALKLLDKSSQDSTATEPWFQTAEEADKAQKHPDLHMVLNLERIVRTPYFRSYWVQGNVTEIAQYRTAVADLYREPTRFREERILIPLAPAADPAPDANLSQLTALVPEHTGVYRAIATHDAAATYATLEEKLLQRATSAAPTGTDAPDPGLTQPNAGDTADLETRIDEAPTAAVVGNRTPALQQLLATSNLEAVLTLDSAGPPAAQSLWIPFHSAIILRAAKPWDRAALESALQADLRTHLTTGNLGLDWKTQTSAAHPYETLSGAHPIALAVDGNLCILTSDSTLMADLLTRLHATPPSPDKQATLIAGFDHTSQRKPYLRLTALLDRSADTPQPGTEPPFLSGNLRSLSDTFATLESEQITEHPEGPNTHQTVLYQWQK